jgi:HEAT repeat protein
LLGQVIPSAAAAALLAVAFGLAPAPVAAADSGPDTATAPDAISAQQYLTLQRKIIAGRATFAEVRQALTDPDIGSLTNTVHGLYSMRWHRGVFNVLHSMWNGKPVEFPELQWTQFAKAPVRLALAGTLLRIEPFRKQDYLDYLREHRADQHEFHRAQVTIGLGFNGSADDVAWIRDMAAGDNPFVAQSAITALGLMDRPQARDALIELDSKFRTDPRGRIISEVLARAYEWPPAESPAAAQSPAD